MTKGFPQLTVTGDDRPPRRAVILAGGRGSRLGALAQIMPKPLLPVQGVSVIDRLIAGLREAGVEHCTVVTCHRAAEVEAHLGDGSHLGVRIDTLLEPRPLGTAGCLGLLDRPSGPFFLVNGDIVTDLCFRTLGERHRRTRATATVGVHRQRIGIEFGVAEFDHDGRLLGYREKPEYEVFVGMGVACLDPRVCGHVSPGEAVTLPEVLDRLAVAGEPVFCHRHDGTWYDIGRREDYDACQRMHWPAVLRAA
jgi:NDP-sugar pyrophosphorylase family protein